MTGHERIITVLNGGIPDRVPTMEWAISPVVTEAMCGVNNEIDFADIMGLDGVAVGINSKNTPFDDRHIIDDWGIKRVTYDEYPNPINERITTMEEFEGFVPPDPDASYRLDKIRAAQKRFGGEKCIVARVKDVVSMPRDLMGYENFLCSLYTEPELLAKLVRMSADYSMRICENLVDIGIEAIVVGDDIATNSGLLMAPDMYREQIYPEFARLVGHAKKLGLKVIKHSDGDLNDVLQDLVDTGIACLDPIDERGNMHMDVLREKYGTSLALKGNIDCVDTLVCKTEQDVIREVARCILLGGKQGALIVSSSNTIHSGVSPKNYKVMLDAVKELGQYPLDIDKLEKIAEME